MTAFFVNLSNLMVNGPTGTIFATGTGTITNDDAPSTNANLSNLVLSAGAIQPPFDPNTTSYTLTVPNSTTSTTVTPTAQEIHDVGTRHLGQGQPHVAGPVVGLVRGRVEDAEAVGHERLFGLHESRVVQVWQVGHRTCDVDGQRDHSRVHFNSLNSHKLVGSGQQFQVIAILELLRGGRA